MLSFNKCGIDEFMLVFLNSVNGYLDEVAFNKPVLSAPIEENKKTIRTIMKNLQQCADPIYRAKNNLVISLCGFRRGQDQTLYKILYDMLDLMNRYYCAKTDEQRFQIKYDMEQLYYAWGYEASDQDCVGKDVYRLKQILSRCRMELYTFVHSLTR